MIIKDHTRIDLAQGGTRFKQGDFVELAFTPRDAAGKVVDLTGKQIEASIWNRSKGVIYQGAASFDSAEKLIRVTIKETLDHGKFQIEFTVTDSTDANYRRKFPSDEYNGVINITPSTDNMDVVGVQMTTVSQLKNELQGLQSDFESSIIPQVDELKQRVDDGVGAFTEDTELLDARMGEPNLRAFNEKLTAQVEDTVKKEEPSSISWAMASQSFREQVTGGNTAVVGVDGVIRENVVRDAIGFEHIFFVEESTNKFNKDDITPGFSISGTTGEPVANASFNITDFERVPAEQPIITDLVGRWAFYDAYKNFISSGTTSSVTTPPNAFYGRFAVANASLSAAQINFGTTLLPYEPHWKRFTATPKTGLELAPTSASVGVKAMQLNSVDPHAATFLKAPVNVFNKHDLRAGFTIDSSGATVADATQSASRNFLPVKPSATYGISHTITIAFYDKNQRFISRLQITQSTGSFQTPATAAYVKVAIVSGNAADLMINEGALLPYADYRFELQSTSQFPLVIPEGGGGETGEGAGVFPFDIPFTYQTAPSLATGAEETVCDISDQCYVQEIEFSTNGALSELEINIRQGDGTLTPYLLMASDASGFVAISPDSLMQHGTTEFLFSEYDIVAHKYKFTMKEKLYANGLQVKIRNANTITKNISCRVVGGSYV